ncbi:mitochondrial GTP/GDP carrier protein 1 [Physcia stellaris]|nr:mitochondrial GTP/GDP carrier protein 1 [Physcia stellaris]
MAPAVVEKAAQGSAAKEFKKESATARLLGSAQAPPVLLSLQYFTLLVYCLPSDLAITDDVITTVSRFNDVIFKDKASATAGKKFTSLFPGLGYAAGYKVLQRIYKYGGQPFARDYLALHHGDTFDRTFGKGNGKAILHATAGSLIGIGEIVLLPLDVLKIKRQTNPEAFRGRGVFRIVADEGMGLYRGAGWTAARNAPGSFALFGGSAAAKEYLYKLTDYNTASYLQNFVASIAGASASLIVSAPLDVIKTRIQNRNFENPESGFKIVGSMMKNEGFTSFFKGLTPKLLMTGPKLVFSFWLAQTLIPAFGHIPTSNLSASKNTEDVSSTPIKYFPNVISPIFSRLSFVSPTTTFIYSHLAPTSPSSTPHPLEPHQKPLFLTLHCLFPNELLPALDLLDRKLVTPENTSTPPPDPDKQTPPTKSKVQKTVYYVRSSHTHSRSRFASKYNKSSISSTEGIHYEVRLRAWNCTCAAFAFAAFSAELERPPIVVMGDEDGRGWGNDSAGGSGGNDCMLTGEPANGGDGRGRWKFGGVTLGEDVPVCKHLLACVLAERVEGLGNYVEERIVGREELAGWAAGWGG